MEKGTTMTEKDKEINELRRENQALKKRLAEVEQNFDVAVDAVNNLARVISGATGTMCDIVGAMTEKGENRPSDATIYPR